MAHTCSYYSAPGDHYRLISWAPNLENLCSIVLERTVVDFSIKYCDAGVTWWLVISTHHLLVMASHPTPPITIGPGSTVLTFGCNGFSVFLIYFMFLY